MLLSFLKALLGSGHTFGFSIGSRVEPDKLQPNPNFATSLTSSGKWRQYLPWKVV